MTENTKGMRGTMVALMVILVGVALIMSLSSCGTSGRVYNVGTGELLPKTYKQ